MVIEKLTLFNFRSYHRSEFYPSEGLNVICGRNAAGKTNLLESVYFCSLGKSPRTTIDKELVRWNSDLVRVSVVLKDKYRKHTVDAYLNSKGEKKILIDGVAISRLHELIGVLNVIYFSPDEMKLVKEQPKERRRFLDIALSSQSKSYLNTLTRYNKILQQRNALLKELTGSTAATLPAFDVQLAEEGFALQTARRDFLEELEEIALPIHFAMSGEQEKLELKYEGEEVATQEELLKLIESVTQKDLFLRYTTVGIHRDDFSIKANGIDLRKFGSQGQQRTASLSLKLALVEMYRRKTGETPVLLLDDVLSELDDVRRNQLMTLTSSSQTMITATEWKEDYEAPKNSRFFTVQDGKIKRSDA